MHHEPHVLGCISLCCWRGRDVMHGIPAFTLCWENAFIISIMISVVTIILLLLLVLTYYKLLLLLFMIMT